MEGSHRSLAIVVALSLLILCSGCAIHRGPAATIPAGTNVTPLSSPSTIPAGPSVAMPGGTKHFAGVP